ncbi:YcdB/YcdC domain-containing protein [Peptococcaceae bacterium 1198_IL3148]
MLKKVLPLVGVLLLTLLLCGTALAAEQPAIADRQQALEVAKKLLPEVVTDKNFDAEYSENDYQGKRVWQLSLHHDGGRPGYHTWIHISIDADTGDLLNYHYNPAPSINAGGNQVVSKDKAQEIAVKFIKRMQPVLFSQMRLEESSHLNNYYNQGDLNLTYYFNWVRIINGIPSQRDGVSVQVDAVTGNIIGYSFNWTDDVKAPQANEKILTKQQVTDLVVENQGFYPTYQIEPDNTAQLVYQLNSRTLNFDAFTGDPVDFNGTVKKADENKVFTVQFNPEIGSKAIRMVAPAEKIDPIEGQRIAEKFFEKMGFKGEVRHSGGGSSVGPGFRHEHWTYSIEREEQNRRLYDVNVGVDVFTGAIVSYRNYSEETNKSEKTISEEQAAMKAEKFIKELIGNNVKYLPREVPQYYIIDDEENYHFEYSTLLNGVPIEGSSIIVAVNRYSGEIVSYNYRPVYVKAPKLEAVISPAEAAEALKKANPFKLSYVNMANDRFNPTNQLALVYQLDNIRGVDAHTGQLLTGAGTGQSVSAQLENHWAKASLELLAVSGLLPETDFTPDGEVTRRQAIKILTAASQYYYGDDGAPLRFNDVVANDADIESIRRAVQLGMFENQGQLNPDALLTREQLAVWLVNGIGYREIADLPVKMEINFKDQNSITDQYKNHVAIAAGLGLFSGDKNGNFNPQQPVTWAELATIVTRVAPKLNAER